MTETLAQSFTTYPSTVAAQSRDSDCTTNVKQWVQTPCLYVSAYRNIEELKELPFGDSAGKPSIISQDPSFVRTSQEKLCSNFGAWRLFLASYIFLQTSLMV